MGLRRTFYMGFGCSIALCAITFLLNAADTYRVSIEKWRQGYEAKLRSDDGWLTLSGLFWLHDGENRFGADARNDIVLHATDMPAQGGSFSLHNGKIFAHVNQGVKITMNGKPVVSAELHPDATADYLHVGDLTIYPHASGARYGIRVKDKNSKFRREFTGLHWFPVDETYHLTARFVPYRPPKQVEIQNVLGDFDKTQIVGYAIFSLQGKEYRLDAEQDEPGTLSFVFRDLTSGKETYPAARFLDTELPRVHPKVDPQKNDTPDSSSATGRNAEALTGGTVILDFNKAYNPPCAYNPYTTCPLPTPGNRLRVAIPAGEKMYRVEHGV